MRFEFHTYGGYQRIEVIAEDTPDTFILGHFSSHPGCPPISAMSLPLSPGPEYVNRGVQE